MHISFVDSELKERVASFIDDLSEISDADFEKKIEEYIYIGAISRPDISFQIRYHRRNKNITKKQKQTVIAQLVERLFQVVI